MPTVSDSTGYAVTMPWLTSVHGPAEAGGVSGYRLVMAWTINGKLGNGNCGALNKALHEAGPITKVTLTLLQPNAAPFDRPMTIPIGRDGRPAERRSIADVAGVEVHDLRAAIWAMTSGPEVLPLGIERHGAPMQLMVRARGFLPGVRLLDMPDVGVLVLYVEQDSTSFRGGLAPGDILLNVPTAQTLTGGSAAPPLRGDTLSLVVRRQGQSEQVTFTTTAILRTAYRHGAR